MKHLYFYFYLHFFAVCFRRIVMALKSADYIVFPFLWSFVKLITSWVNDIALTSLWLAKHCRFFIKLLFLGHSISKRTSVKFDFSHSNYRFHFHYISLHKFHFHFFNYIRLTCFDHTNKTKHYSKTQPRPLNSRIWGRVYLG